jgi:hypothetical protein
MIVIAQATRRVTGSKQPAPRVLAGEVRGISRRRRGAFHAVTPRVSGGYRVPPSSAETIAPLMTTGNFPQARAVMRRDASATIAAGAGTPFAVEQVNGLE